MDHNNLNLIAELFIVVRFGRSNRPKNLINLFTFHKNNNNIT